jgi:hypothetical protein
MQLGVTCCCASCTSKMIAEDLGRRRVASWPDDYHVELSQSSTVLQGHKRGERFFLFSLGI